MNVATRTISHVVPQASTPEPIPHSFAPLVYNAWYVLAEKAKVGRELLGIRALGEQLVMYRTEAGEAVVLSDLCVHRRFPLSKSHLVGDTIRCGYHGFTYDQSGKCIFTPGKGVIGNFGVRSYPAVERGPWLWAWMGDPELADPEKIPFEDHDRTWDGHSGYTHNPSNYMVLVENLLDVTHLHYLHGVLADEAYANTPPTPVEEDGIWGWRKEVPASRVGPQGSWVGASADRLCHVVEKAIVHLPNLFESLLTRTPVAGEADPVFPNNRRVLHALTPEDLNGTHQFWLFQTDCPLTAPADEILTAIQYLFGQDTEVVAILHKMILDDPYNERFQERSIITDRYGLKVRQLLRKMAAEEAAAGTHPTMTEVRMDRMQAD